MLSKARTRARVRGRAMHVGTCAESQLGCTWHVVAAISVALLFHQCLHEMVPVRDGPMPGPFLPQAIVQRTMCKICVCLAVRTRFVATEVRVAGNTTYPGNNAGSRVYLCATLRTTNDQTMADYPCSQWTHANATACQESM